MCLFECSALEQTHRYFASPVMTRPDPTYSATYSTWLWPHETMHETGLFGEFVGGQGKSSLKGEGFSLMGCEDLTHSHVLNGYCGPVEQ